MSTPSDGAAVGSTALSLTVFLETGSAWNDSACSASSGAGVELPVRAAASGTCSWCRCARAREGFEAPGMTVGYLKIGASSSYSPTSAGACPVRIQATIALIVVTSIRRSRVGERLAGIARRAL